MTSGAPVTVVRRFRGCTTVVPRRDVERARIVEVPGFLPGYAAITLGRFVLVRRDHAHDDALIEHELVHVRQWREQGAAEFLWRYATGYLRNRRAGLAHRDAYLAIPAEEEARRLSGR